MIRRSILLVTFVVGCSHSISSAQAVDFEVEYIPFKLATYTGVTEETMAHRAMFFGDQENLPSLNKWFDPASAVDIDCAEFRSTQVKLRVSSSIGTYLADEAGVVKTASGCKLLSPQAMTLINSTIECLGKSPSMKPSTWKAPDKCAELNLR